MITNHTAIIRISFTRLIAIKFNSLIIRGCQNTKITVCFCLPKDKSRCNQASILQCKECNKYRNFTSSCRPSGTYWKTTIFLHFQIHHITINKISSGWQATIKKDVKPTPYHSQSDTSKSKKDSPVPGSQIWFQICRATWQSRNTWRVISFLWLQIAQVKLLVNLRLYLSALVIIFLWATNQ